MHIDLTEEDIREVRARAAAGKAALTDIVTSLLKWLFASILAINAGAAITVLNMEEIQPRALFWAEVFFVGGIVTALVSGFVTMFYALKFFPNQELVMNLKPGRYDRDALSRALDSEDADEPWRDPLVYVGLVPIILFLAGIAVIASNLASQ